MALASSSIFQYPQSDRRRCNNPLVPVPQEVNHPFSILNRIGGDATPAWGHPRREMRSLSVSSIGSEAMQLRPPDRDAGHPPLSVSSIGSEAMQPGGPTSKPAFSLTFQYPQSDRRRCNASGFAPGGARSIFQYPQSDRRRCNKEDTFGR